MLLEKKFEKISENPLDKSPKLWYNKGVRGEETRKRLAESMGFVLFE